MGNYCIDDSYRDLRILEAGNLYFIIAIKAKVCTTFENPDCVFEIIDGNEDIKRLQEIYEKESFYNPKQTGVQFLQSLDEAYKNLTTSHISNTILIEETVKKYELVKSYYFTELTDVEQIVFLQNNISDHLNDEISVYKEEEKIKRYNSTFVLPPGK